MSKLESHTNLEYHGKRYTLSIIKTGRNEMPLLLDRSIYKVLKRMDKKWYINDKNHIYCHHGHDRANAPIYIHETVMKIGQKKRKHRPIIHINNIHFDNRLENLQYDDHNKDYGKNTRKKKRLINLSRHGINSKDLPTYMWYLNPDSSHGSRFMIDIPDEISWKSTASKQVSLRYKLEQSKKYLRFLQKIRPDIFNYYSMNGDLNQKGMKLYNEYRKIISFAGYDMPKLNIQTSDFLKEDAADLTDQERYLLHSFNPKNDKIDIRQKIKDYNILFA